MSDNKLSLRSTGIIVAAAAIFAFFMGLVVAGVLNLTPHASTQEKTTPLPLVTEEGTSPFVSVASSVMPAVVNISTSRIVKNQIGGMQFQGPFGDLFKQFMGPQESEQKVASLGSGVIFDERGYIITNNHIVEKAAKVTVTAGDQSYTAKVVGTDPRSDLALIKIEGKNLPSV